MCIRDPAKSQMTFDLQTILVQDQTFHLSNHAQEVTQLLALEYIFFWIFTAEKDSQLLFSHNKAMVDPILCSAVLFL
jgi:hypothetical protein